VSTTITVDLGCHAVLTDPDDLLGQKVPLDLDGAPAGDATVVQVNSDPRGGLRAELEVPAAVGSRLEGARLTMPMPVRRWLHCRGLLHSPSWGLIYEQGTLLRPGRRYEYVPRIRRYLSYVNPNPFCVSQIQ
jgi:hypothetical protein